MSIVDDQLQTKALSGLGSTRMGSPLRQSCAAARPPTACTNPYLQLHLRDCHGNMMNFWRKPFPSASRQRQDSLLQTYDEQKEERRRRTSSSAKDYLNSLTQQTHEEESYQPFLPPRHRRESSQQVEAEERRHSLARIRHNARRQPLYTAPHVPAFAPVFKKVKIPGPEIRITRYWRRYTRCCGREWLTGVYFTSISRASSSGKSKATAVSPITDLSLRTDDEDICYRCLDRLRCCSWHIIQSTAYPEPLLIKQVDPAGGVQYGYERQPIAGLKGDESGTDADDEDEHPARHRVEDEDGHWSSGDETVVPEKEYGGADAEMEMGEGVDAAAVEAAMCLLGMAKVE